jgi:hypothetical protein
MATDLKAWRGRNDDGTEITATWKAAQNVSWTQLVNTNFRIRFLHQQSVALLNNLDVQLQYSLDNSVWVNVTASSLVIRSSASANVTDAANLTAQMTGGTGTFIGATAFDEVNGICGGNSLDVTATGNFETEFSVQLRGADTTNGQTVYLRTINSDTSAAWETFTGGVASLTVSNPARTAAPAADNWNNEADVAPSLYADHYFLFIDPWGGLDDTDGVAFDKQDAVGGGSTPITRNIPADPWLNLGDSFTGARTREATAAIDSWGTLGDTNGVAFDRPAADVGPSAKTATPPADPWNNEVDQTPSLRADHYLTFSDPWNNLGDTNGVAFDRPAAPTGPTLKTITPPADANTAYTDQFDAIRTAITFTDPDDFNQWADSRAGFETYRATPPVDAWANLADQAPTIFRTGRLTAVPGADALGLGTDSRAAFETYKALPTTEALNFWNDDKTVDIQVVGATDITRNLGPDSLNNWLDNFIGSKSREATGAPDGLNLWADSPAISLSEITTTPRTIAPPADSLGLYADQAPTARESLFTRPDADVLFIGTGGYYGGGDYGEELYGSDLDSIQGRLVYAARPATDTWQNLTDQAPTIDRVVIATPKTAVPGADAWANLADQPPTINLVVITTTARNVTPPADSLGLYGDQAPKAFETFRAQPAPDSLGLYSDQDPSTFETYRAAPAPDPWLTLADQPAAVIRMAPRTAAPAADSLGLYSDATAARFLYGKSYDLGLDSMVQTDSLAGFFTIKVHVADSWGNLADGSERFAQLFYSLFDTRPPFEEALDIRLGAFNELFIQVPIDNTFNNWADAATLLRQIYALKLNGKVTDVVVLNGKVIEENITLNGRVSEQVSLTGEAYQGDL